MIFWTNTKQSKIRGGGNSKDKSCVKLPEMARKSVENDFGFFASPLTPIKTNKQSFYKLPKMEKN